MCRMDLKVRVYYVTGLAQFTQPIPEQDLAHSIEVRVPTTSVQDLKDALGAERVCILGEPRAMVQNQQDLQQIKGDSHLVALVKAGEDRA